MMRSNPSNSMQKCYDDCFLVCSTAIYFEQQNNEAEALRSWKNALDQIYYHNAYRLPAQYRPRSETEKALQASLKQLELQCKERVDLLEALKQSRTEVDGVVTTDTSGDSSFASTTRTVSNTDGGGWIGGGTVPPISYPDLAKPPTLPKRPLPPVPRASSGRPSIMDAPRQPSQQSINLLTPTITPVEKRRSRTPSPEKKGGLLRTLRQPGKSSASASKSRKSAVYKSQPPLAAAGAATSAWSSGSRPTSQSSAPQETLSDISRVSSRPSVPVVSTPTRNTQESTGRNSQDGGQGSATLDAEFGSRLSMSEEGTPRRSEDRPSPYPRNMRNTAMISTSDSPSDTPATRVASEPSSASAAKRRPKSPPRLSSSGLPKLSYRKEYANPSTQINPADAVQQARRLRGLGPTSPPETPPSNDSPIRRKAVSNRPQANSRAVRNTRASSEDDFSSSGNERPSRTPRQSRRPRKAEPAQNRPMTPSTEASVESDSGSADKAWDEKVKQLLKKLPRGIDEAAAKQILNEIVIKGDEVHWSDVAGLDIAKNALKENVVYPFLRPDLFSGLREPARGMLLFGPPGTGKTMLARAVATESRSTFFAISASSLTSKFLGDSEKLVRALFGLAKELAPSIIFVDEIDSLLSSRSDSGEHEASRRIKTEFLIQWSDLARAAAGSQSTDRERGDASRVLVLAATNLPWAIDEAARRRFVRRQYIPLPEDGVRATQLSTLLSHQKHSLTPRDIARLVVMTEGFSGSDITALAKDAAMGPLRSLGELLLHTPMDAIRPIGFADFQASLTTIRPSVSKQGLKQFEDWAAEYGERGG